MAKLIVSNIISLDGFCAGPGGNPMALPMDGAFNAYNAQRLRSAGTLLLGRTTFEMFRGFWPGMEDNPAAEPVVQETARLNRAIDKLVVSDSLALEPASPWGDARVLRRAAVRGAIVRLKAVDGPDILVFGSRTMWNGLLALGLVDELHLMVGNVVLGAGVPAFDPQSAPASLRLVGERRWEDSHNVLLQYACAVRAAGQA